MDQLREEIKEKCGEYFGRAYSEKTFVAGDTYIPVASQTMGKEDLINLVEASLDMNLSWGKFTLKFEAELATALMRRTSALLTNSGSSANLVAMTALTSRMLDRPIEKGGEVITAACGFPTTLNPIIQNGLTPVFIDVDYGTLNALPEMVMAARTKDTCAVILSHTLGNPFRADLLKEWCEREGIYLIEDSCDALGAYIGGAPAGSYGDYATFSFYPAHHISMGEGGAVVSRNGLFRKVAASIRDWGRDCWCNPGKDNTCKKRFEQDQAGGLPCGYDHKYTYSNIGYNLKATELQASLGVTQLQKLPSFVEARRANHAKLSYGIKSSPLLSKYLRPISATPESSPSWFGFPLHCLPGVDRSKLLSYLEEHKVGTRLVFGGNLTKQPAYKHSDYRIHGELKNTDQIMEKTFWIGVHPGLTIEKITYMLEVLENGVKAQAP